MIITVPVTVIVSMIPMRTMMSMSMMMTTTEIF